MANDQFGTSVSLISSGAGYVALVGANNKYIGTNPLQGSAYIFTSSNGASWTQAQKLTASEGAADDWFGTSVSLIFNGAGYVALVGANVDDIGAITNQGSAYIFTSSNGSSWSQVQRLTASDGVANDYFGASVLGEPHLQRRWLCGTRGGKRR